MQRIRKSQAQGERKRRHEWLHEVQICEDTAQLVGPVVVLGGEVLGILFEGGDGALRGGRDLCEGRVDVGCDYSLELNLAEARERASRGPCTRRQRL